MAARRDLPGRWTVALAGVRRRAAPPRRRIPPDDPGSRRLGVASEILLAIGVFGASLSGGAGL